MHPAVYQQSVAARRHRRSAGTRHWPADKGSIERWPAVCQSNSAAVQRRWYSGSSLDCSHQSSHRARNRSSDLTQTYCRYSVRHGQTRPASSAPVSATSDHIPADPTANTPLFQRPQTDSHPGPRPDQAIHCESQIAPIVLTVKYLRGTQAIQSDQNG